MVEPSVVVVSTWRYTVVSSDDKCLTGNGRVVDEMCWAVGVVGRGHLMVVQDVSFLPSWAYFPPDFLKIEPEVKASGPPLWLGVSNCTLSEECLRSCNSSFCVGQISLTSQGCHKDEVNQAIPSFGDIRFEIVVSVDVGRSFAVAVMQPIFYIGVVRSTSAPVCFQLQMAGSWDDNPDKHLLSWMGINAFETNLSLAFRQTDDVYPIPPHRGDVSCLLWAGRWRAVPPVSPGRWWAVPPVSPTGDVMCPLCARQVMCCAPCEPDRWCVSVRLPPQLVGSRKRSAMVPLLSWG